MDFKKSLLAIATAVALSSAANATVVNVGGVTWDTDSPLDFSSKVSLTEISVSFDPGKQELYGYGIVSEFNSTSGPNQSEFCPTCQLTFAFNNYILADQTGAGIAFTGGSFQLYVQDTAAVGYTPYNLADMTTAIDGDLWLALVGVEYGELLYPGFPFNGSLFGELTAGSLGTGDETGTGSGFLEVDFSAANSGLAASYFDTNTFGGLELADGTPVPAADLLFSSSFQPNLSGIGLDLNGTGEIQGDTEVPEPSSLALLGLGALVAGASMRRRKQKKA